MKTVKKKMHDPIWDESDYTPDNVGDGCAAFVLFAVFALQGLARYA